VIEIKQCRLSEVTQMPQFETLVEEYADEAAIEGLPRPCYNKHIYKTLEQSGMMHPLCSFNENELSGFINILVNVIPHYGNKIATSESFFVRPKFRKGGTGLKLIEAAEQLAKQQGAIGCLISAPANSRLDVVLSRSSYTHSNNVYFKSLL